MRPGGKPEKFKPGEQDETGKKSVMLHKSGDVKFTSNPAAVVDTITKD